MNIEAWKKLREALLNEENLEFDMADWGGEENLCGTSACLAGFTCHAHGMNIVKMSCGKIEEEAKQILDIKGWYQKDHVFFGRWKPKPGDALTQTREEALEYVEKAIAAQDPMVTL